jgi:hypothetical protein
MTNLQLSFIKACTTYAITSNLFTNASILWLYVANNAESKFVRVFFSVGAVFFAIMPVLIISDMEKRFKLHL